MSFIRRKSIDLKKSIPNHLLTNNTTLNSISLSLNQSTQVQLPQKNTVNPAQTLQSIRKLSSQLSQISKQKWQQKVSEQLSLILQIKKGVLIAVKVSLYRESIILMTKYQIQMKKTGSQLNEKTSNHCISLFKNIIDELNKITQDQRNIEHVLQSNLYEPVFQFLQVIALTAESQFCNNKQKRSALIMRKNTLKKVQEASTITLIRPLSRGKLSSLTKKDNLLTTSKRDILQIRPPSSSSKQEQSEARSLLQQLILSVFGLVKCFCQQAKLRKNMFKEQFLRIINRYLCIWNDKNNTSFGTQLMIQLTSCYRDLSAEDKSHKIFLKSNCFDAWTRMIELFPASKNIIFNILRIISKLSNYESVCLKMNEKKQFIKTLTSFFKFYKNDIHIIIRLAFIFANMTSYLSDIRNQLYFDFNAWQDIFVCFDHYATIELSGKNEVQKMGLSMAAWDYQALKKQSDIEAVIKIIRLIANIFTVSQIGKDIYLNDSISYKQLIKKLKGLLQKKSNIQKSSELIACILSCFTNVLYYDRELLMSNPEYKGIKCQLVSILVDFVVQIDNEQICCEALRVISNISRMKQFVKIIIQAKIHLAIMILVESTSKQIVYYSLGILINLMVDDEFKQQNKQIIINNVLEILNECTGEDFDLVTIGLKTLAVLLEAGNQNIDPETLSKVQGCLMNLGSHCDKIMMNKDGQNNEMNSIQESRSLINSLLNSMPEEKFICPVKNCGRKFQDDIKLQDHVKRRHKLS